MEVSILELARRQLVTDAPLQSPATMPFALQRLFQGRQLEIPVPGSGEGVSVQVLQWAFACGDPERFIPGRFSLAAVGAKEPIDFCCLKGIPALYQHDLFADDRRRFASLWKRVELARSADVLKVGDKCALESARGRANLWLWRGCVPVPNLPYRTEHELLLAALLERLVGPSKDTLDGIAETLLANVIECIQILQGREPGELPTASIRNSLPREQGPAPAIEVRGSSWSDMGTAAVDRLLAGCWRLRHCDIGEDDFALSVLVIRRCGEPPGNDEAHAKFALGKQQWCRLEYLASEQFEARSDAIAERAVELREKLSRLWQGEKKSLWEDITIGLRRLGFDKPAIDSEEELRRQCRGSRSGLPNKESFVKGVRDAFRRSFPVSAVVSNRVMNSCLCELVGDLWSSPGLLETLKAYPRDTLLCEMAFFPDAVGKELFYVPLMLPSSRQQPSAAGYFLSYAVAMSPASVVHPDTFREIAEQASEDLYLSFLEDIYKGLATVADNAGKCERSVSENLMGNARDSLSAAISEYENTITDLLRLADFQINKREYFGHKELPWELERAAFDTEGRTRLAHGIALAQIEQLADRVFNSAIGEVNYHSLLISRHIRNIDHSGLLIDLARANALAGSLLTMMEDVSRGAREIDLEEATRKLLTLQAEVRLAQERWAQLVHRHAGRLDEREFKCINETDCRYHFEAALDSIRRRSEPVLFDIESCMPELECRLGEHVVREHPGVLREIFHNLLTNRIKHEPTVKNGVRWGLELNWVSGEDVYALPLRLREAWQHWRPTLRESRGACLIRAYPNSMEDTDLQTMLQDAIWGTDLSHLGLYALVTYTRAYDSRMISGARRTMTGGGRLSADASVPIISVTNGPKPGLLVLLPGG